MRDRSGGSPEVVLLTAAPRAIFPHRDIGHLDDGAEASFLVLSGDPLADFAHTHDIAMRGKQGTVLGRPRTGLMTGPPQPTSLTRTARSQPCTSRGCSQHTDI
jgi:hypothetical protein